MAVQGRAHARMRAHAKDIRGSASTTAMVAFALAAVDGRFGHEPLVEPTNHRSFDERGGAAARELIVNTASQWLRAELADQNSGRVKPEASTQLTTILDGVDELIAIHDDDRHRSVHSRLNDARARGRFAEPGSHGADHSSSVWPQRPDDPVLVARRARAERHTR